MTNTKLNKAVQQTYGTKMDNARKSIGEAFNGFADIQVQGGSATENCAKLCCSYFTTYFNEPRWMVQEAIEDNKALQAEKKIIRDMLNNALIERGLDATNLRIYWKRVQDKAFELTFPKEAEAKKLAKKQADADRKASKAGKGEGEPTTADISPEMMEYASLLAGACDWDKSLANRVLAMVFAQATKA